MFSYQQFLSPGWWPRLRDWLLSWLYPRRCAGCQTSDTYLCLTCAQKIPADDRWSAYDELAATPYRQPTIRRLIWLLKYRGVRDIAPTLAGLIHDRLFEEIVERAKLVRAKTPYLIIPIPLAAKRERRRGFNQATAIAQALVALDPQTFMLATDVLVKIKNTPAQVSLGSRSARLKNLRGVFRLIWPKLVQGQFVILLDDVATTGATLDTAAAAIKRGRPLHLIKITVAR